MSDMNTNVKEGFDEPSPRSPLDTNTIVEEGMTNPFRGSHSIRILLFRKD